MGTKAIIAILLLLGLVISGLSISFMKGFTMFIWLGVGLGLVLISGIGIIFSNLYVKASGNLAYLKTGKGGPKVIKDEGRVIIGFLHNITPVSLETMKIIVKREGKDSLITLDKLRAEVIAEFYIRVKADPEGIATAARTLGDKIAASKVKGDDGDVLVGQIEKVSRLEEEKLIDALRTVAAQKTLEDLNLLRSEFKKAVMDIVKEGLEQNGLELEDVTISKLDQASKDFMDPNNQFDAQGLMNLQKVVSASLIQENEFKRNAELAIKTKDVSTKTAILAQDQDLSFKTADQQREVRSYEANQNKEASIAEIQTEETVAKRGIEKDKAIALEGVTKEQKIQTANVEKEQAIEIAGVTKNTQVEVAEKQKQIIVAQKDKERATTETERNLAQAEAEKASQAVKTVTVVAEAERDKEKTIVQKKGETERTRLEAQVNADVKAYATAKEAEGRKEAAEADYVAKTKAADADLIEKTKQAQGAEAIAMVPVNVAAAQVEVDKNRVAEVLKPELEAKAQHEKVSIDLTLGQLKIEAAKEIGVAYAGSLATMMSNANMTIYGDPETLAKMTEKFSKGVGLSNMIDGFISGGDGLQGILSVVGPVLSRFGIDMSGVKDVAALKEVVGKIEKGAGTASQKM
jgi:uncharacterized membrane protein YqiK